MNQSLTKFSSYQKVFLDSGAAVEYPPAILEEKKIGTIVVTIVKVELVRKYINSLQGKPDTVLIIIHNCFYSSGAY